MHRALRAGAREDAAIPFFRHETTPRRPEPAHQRDGDARPEQPSQPSHHRSPVLGKIEPMSQLRVHAFSVSLDGYGAGPNQSIDAPLGENGEQLHEWIVDTRTFRALQGLEGGETGVDDDFVAAGFDGIGPWIMGRNMFGPVRGEWPDDTWKGWWGDNPPYHHEVFVLTHHVREPVEMEGGTTFHFVTDGIESALDRARGAAGDLDIRLGGGADTIKQYMRAGLVDRVHLAIVPVLLGDGERLLDDLGSSVERYSCTEWLASPKATHAVLTRVD